MIPFLDKTAVKIGLTITLIGLLFAFYKWHYNNIFEAGQNSVRAELMEQYQEREKDLNEKLKTALEENKKEKETASKIQNDLREMQKDNLRLRDEIHNSKNNFNCDSLGDDFLQLWNKTIGEEPKYD